MKIELSFIRGDPNEQKRAIHHPMRKYKILAQEIQINTEKNGGNLPYQRFLPTKDRKKPITAAARCQNRFFPDRLF